MSDDAARILYDKATTPPAASIFDLYPAWDWLDEDERELWREMAREESGE